MRTWMSPLLVCLFSLTVAMAGIGLVSCSGTKVKDQPVESGEVVDLKMPLTKTQPAKPEKLAKRGMQLLTPESTAFNPVKGRAYLEYALKHGDIKSLEVPTPVLLELLRGERLARKKSQALEQQLMTMKEIDLEGEESNGQEKRTNSDRR